jgi:hypothetical protein
MGVILLKRIGLQYASCFFGLLRFARHDNVANF